MYICREREICIERDIDIDIGIDTYRYINVWFIKCNLQTIEIVHSIVLSGSRWVLRARVAARVIIRIVVHY